MRVSSELVDIKYTIHTVRAKVLSVIEPRNQNPHKDLKDPALYQHQVS